MPSGIEITENDGQKKTNQTQPEVVQKTRHEHAFETTEIPRNFRLQNSIQMEDRPSRRGLKRGNLLQEQWPESDNSRMSKKMRIKYEHDEQPKPQNEQFGYVCSTGKRTFVIKYTVYSMPKQAPKQVKQTPNVMKSRRSGCRRSRRRASNRSCRRSSMCRKTYYRKRRYCCPGKRRYKASKRCCPSKYNKNRINMCNRNWARISIHPFINFLRVFRRKFCKGTPPNEIVKKGKIEWKKMTCNNKKKFYEQAKRARIRGYRT